MESEKLLVKENVVQQAPVALRWLAAACALAGATLAAAALADRSLPAPLARGAPPHRFIAEIAHEHLVNLTKIGPRVAGSYENEVLGVGAVVAAVKQIAREAGPHVRVELDVQTVSGAFSLAFLDGMNHVYQDVSNVVVRLSAAGAGRAGAAARSALLFNCHIDTVPDSPGASDDAAGCAVLLETLRALAAAGPPRHAALFLFNGAEENVLQASHGFITQHKWAREVRAFLNIEACGAGGREVLFQAGPHDPWLVEAYAGAVPHPFASSLAQELFESGLIPADTDFRIFRDFGNLSGLDLAWSSNGYVYHTALDAAARVPPAALQRTGDNVLALARGLLSSERLEEAVERSARQPVFFDVLGVVVLSARAPAALLGAALALAAALADTQLAARQAETQLFLARGAWWRLAARGAAVCALAAGAGLGAAAGVALALHGAGARLSFYSRPWLLAPLYGAPALAAAGAAGRLLGARWLRAAGARGWWAARALQQGAALLAGALLAGAVLRGLRSGFLPALWTALPAGAGLLSAAAGCWRGRGRRAPGAWWAAGALLPALQTWYLALGSLRMLAPLMGRAGAPPLPPDVLVAAVTAALALAACSWLLPLVLGARRPLLPLAVLLGASVGASLLALAGEPYSREAPQRLMVLHTRRQAPAPAPEETFYWVPQLDANTERSLRALLAGARRVAGAECAAGPYCALPYHLPAAALVPASHRAPAPPLPRAHPARLHAQLRREGAALHVAILRGPAHAVLCVAPARGARVARAGALLAPLASSAPPPEPGRRVYFFALHGARRPPAPLTLLLEGEGAHDEALVALAGHALAAERAPAHERLLRALPDWTAPTGWAVDLQLHRL